MYVLVHTRIYTCIGWVAHALHGADCNKCKCITETCRTNGPKSGSFVSGLCLDAHTWAHARTHMCKDYQLHNSAQCRRVVCDHVYSSSTASMHIEYPITTQNTPAFGFDANSRLGLLICMRVCMSMSVCVCDCVCAIVCARWCVNQFRWKSRLYFDLRSGPFITYIVCSSCSTRYYTI